MAQGDNARIAPVQPDADARLDRYRDPDGSPIALFGIHAHSAPALQHLIRSTTMSLRDVSIPVRNRELLVLRIQARRGAIAEWHTHVAMFAESAGLDEAELRRLRDDGVRGWEPEDAALLRLADALVDGTGIDDESWGVLRTQHDDRALVELCVVAAQYLAVASLHAVFAIDGAPRVVA